MSLDRRFYVYIMASHSRVLYIGTTSDLRSRIFQHRWRMIEGFTHRYRVIYLVYFEETINSRAAVAREREIKGWNREKKCHLIETINSGWEDLACSWFPVQAG